MDSKQQKRLKYLIIALILSVIALLIFFTEEKIIGELPPVGQTIYRESISINTSILKEPILQVLQPFESISLPDDIEIGRENPFIPY